MKMMKATLLAILLMGSVGVHAKDVAIPKEAVGIWKLPDGSVDENNHITSQGFKWIANSPKKCRDQKVSYVTGQKLLKAINESIKASTDEYQLTEKKDVQMALKLIKPNQKYVQIFGASKCADGYNTFTLLDKNHALSAVASPDEVYVDLHK